MIQSRVQQVSGVAVPTGGFLLNPENAQRVIGQSQLRSVLKAEVVGLVVLIALSLLLLLIGLQGLRPLLQVFLVQQTGTATDGIITGSRTLPAGGNGHVMYFLRYHFTDASGQSFETEQVVTRQTFERIQAGYTVPVKYLSNQPGYSALSGDARDDAGVTGNVFVMVTGLVGFLAAAGGAYWLGWYIWREERLFRFGQLVTGHVMTCQGTLELAPQYPQAEEQGTPPRGSFTINLTYAFHSPDGTPIKSKALRQRNDLRGQVLPSFGHPVLVLYCNEQHYKVL